MNCQIFGFINFNITIKQHIDYSVIFIFIFRILLETIPDFDTENYLKID